MSDVWEKKEGMLERLRALCADRDSGSFTAIADKLNREFGTNVSRSAVLGKAHRLKIAKRPRPQTQAPRFKQPVPKPAPKPAPVAAIAKPAPLSKPAPPQPTVVLDRAACKHPDGVHLSDLRGHHCKWPLWDHREQPTLMFCGETAEIGPYCGGHAALSYPNMQARRHAQSVYGRIDGNATRRAA
jgi:hypothetical protein